MGIDSRKSENFSLLELKHADFLLDTLHCQYQNQLQL